MANVAIPGFEDMALSGRIRSVLGVLAGVGLIGLWRLATLDVHPNPMFHPHGYCYLWEPALVTAHVASDGIIGASYFAISVTLAYVVYRGRRDIPFSWMFLTFGAFIVACGATHLMEVVTLWQPVFWTAADVKIVTAIASLGAAVALPPLVPRVFTLVDAARLSETRRRALEHANEVLESRVADRTAALEQAVAREQELRRRAETLNRMKDEFLGIVSHELRTPLNAILGWSDMLSRGVLPQAASARAIGSIQKNATAQAQLVDELLDVSGIIAGKLRIERESVALNTLLTAALDTVRPTASTKHVSLELRAPDETLFVTGDPRRLHQIFWNLLSNAVKFTPEGGSVLVTTRVEQRRVQVMVRDTGIGIDSGFMPYLFDRFSQADSSPTRSYSGLGLGLALVRHLVELHGGTVTAASDGPGKGATFTVALPLEVLGESLRTRHEHAVSTVDAPDLNGTKVLLVDDDPDSLEVMSAGLTACGAVLTTATSADAALESLMSSRFDVIVADIAMPQRDGFDLIRELRERGDTTAALALTAHVRSEDRARVLAAGFRLYVPKPATPVEVAWAIASLQHR